MTQSIDEKLQRATCAIHRGGGNGTGWLCSNEGHILTAAHVLGETKPEDGFTVNVTFVDKQKPFESLARLEHWYYDKKKGIDFAVLKLVDIPPNREPLPMSLAKEVAPRSQIRLYGYGTKLTYLSSGIGEFVGRYSVQNISDYTLFLFKSDELNIGGFSGGL